MGTGANALQLAAERERNNTSESTLAQGVEPESCFTSLLLRLGMDMARENTNPGNETAPNSKYHVIDPRTHKYARDASGRTRTTTRRHFDANPDKFTGLTLGDAVGDDTGGGTAHEDDEVSNQTADGTDKEDAGKEG